MQRSVLQSTAVAAAAAAFAAVASASDDSTAGQQAVPLRQRSRAAAPAAGMPAGRYAGRLVLLLLPCLSLLQQALQAPLHTLLL